MVCSVHSVKLFADLYLPESCYDVELSAEDRELYPESDRRGRRARSYRQISMDSAAFNGSSVETIAEGDDSDLRVSTA